MIKVRHLLFLAFFSILILVALLAYPLFKPGLILVTPPGTDIYINNELIESKNINLKPGSYNLIAAKEGYLKVNKKIYIGSFGKTKIEIFFAKKLATLKLPPKQESDSYEIKITKNKYYESEYFVYYLTRADLNKVKNQFKLSEIDDNNYKITYIFEGDETGHLEAN